MKYVRGLIFLLAPLLLVSLLVVHLAYSPYKSLLKARFQFGWLYVFSLTATFWTFNVLHVASISFMVLLMLPLVGTTDATTLCKFFMSDYNAAVLGSLIVAMAAIACGLQKRLATTILKHSGGSLRWIAFYLYFATTWIAIWSNGAAATFFMLGTIDECFADIKEHITEQIMLRSQAEAQPEAETEGNPNPDSEATEAETGEKVEEEGTSSTAGPNESNAADTKTTSEEMVEELEQILDKLGGELLYMVAVAASIGEFAWPFGNPMGYALLKLGGAVGVSQATWFLFSFPLILLNSLIAMGYLIVFKFSRSWKKTKPKLEGFAPNPVSFTRNLGDALYLKHKTSEKWNFREFYTLFIWGFGTFLCLSRDTRFITGAYSGWGTYLGFLRTSGFIFIGDSAPYIFMGVMIFLLPSWDIEVFKGPKKLGDKLKPSPYSLGWKKVQSTYPYSVLIFIGATGVLGRYSEGPWAQFVANAYQPIVSAAQLYHAPLKFCFLGMCALLSFLLPNPGSSIAVAQVWNLTCVNNMLCDTFLLPIFSILSCSIVLPCSSVSTVIAYNFQEKKKLSAWYFLFVGAPLYICLMISTAAYSGLWITANSLRQY